MKIIRSTILKRITTFALLLAMVAGMATALGRKADAGSIPNGYYRITLKCFNKTQTKTVDVLAGQYSNYKLPQQTSDQYGSFLYWKRQSDGKTFAGGTTVSINGHTTFTAIWSTTAVFRSYNGNIIQSKTVTTGSPYGTLPTAPYRGNGYVFDGWYYNGTKITPSTVVSVGGRHDITARYRFEVLPDAGIDEILKGVYDPNGKFGTAWYTRGGGYIPQVTREGGGGMCTTCAVTNLLNRKLARETKTMAYRFDYEKDVIPQMYRVPASAGYLFYDGNYKYHFNTETNYRETGFSITNSKGSGSYQRTYTLTRVLASGDKNAQLRALLLQHPEGVVMHVHGHAIVVTGCKGDVNGNYTYYAIDTASCIFDKNINATSNYQYNGSVDLIYSWVNADNGKKKNGADIVSQAGSFFYLN